MRCQCSIHTLHTLFQFRGEIRVLENLGVAVLGSGELAHGKEEVGNRQVLLGFECLGEVHHGVDAVVVRNLLDLTVNREFVGVDSTEENGPLFTSNPLRSHDVDHPLGFTADHSVAVAVFVAFLEHEQMRILKHEVDESAGSSETTKIDVLIWIFAVPAVVGCQTAVQERFVHLVFLAFLSRLAFGCMHSFKMAPDAVSLISSVTTLRKITREWFIASMDWRVRAEIT